VPTDLVAHFQNRTSPTLKPSFVKEPPSKCTKTAVKWTDNNTTEKKHEPVTWVWCHAG